MMRNNKGITMVSLVVTIVILLILSTITLNFSIDSYKAVKVQNFIAKLKVIQSKVDNIAEQTDDVSNYGFTSFGDITDGEEIFYNIINNPKEYNITSSWNSELDSDPENYYYFTPQDLEDMLGLEDQDLTVIINFKTRNVISKTGVEQDDIVYYRQYDLAGGEKLN